MTSSPGLTPLQHFTISLTVGSLEHSPPHQWKSSHGGHLHYKEILKKKTPKIVGCNTLYFNYGYNLTFKFDCPLSQYNDEFATYNANRSRSNGFLPDIYQVWNEVIWLTPEKGRLISTAPICWEQIEPSPEISQQLNYSDWKHLGFLLQEICNVIIPVFSNPNSGPPFVWPGTDWDWISQSC